MYRMINDWNRKSKFCVSEIFSEENKNKRELGEGKREGSDRKEDNDMVN